MKATREAKLRRAIAESKIRTRQYNAAARALDKVRKEIRRLKCLKN